MTVRRRLLALALVAGAVMAPERARAQTTQLPPPAAFGQDVVLQRPPAVASAWGYPAMDVDQDRILELVRARSFDQVRTVLDGYRNQVLRDVRWEEHLMAAYRAFYGPDRDLRPLLEEWVARVPASAESHVARAEFFLARAWEARGTGRSSTVGSQQWQVVNAYRRKALDDATQGLALDPANLAAHVALLDVLRFDGWSDRAERVLASALERFPTSYVIRFHAMGAMQPRWGGSYESMALLAQAAQPYASQNPRLRVLLGAVLLEQARILRGEEDYANALETLDQASRYEADWDLPYERGRVWYFAGDPVRALGEFNQALALRPNSYTILEARGRALRRIAERFAPADRRVEVLTAAEADLAFAARRREASANLDAWLAYVTRRKAACAAEPTTCFPPRSDTAQVASKPAPPTGWIGWAGRIFLFVIGIPYTLWMVLRELNDLRLGPVPWLALGIIAWSFVEWRRQRYWTPPIVHVMAGLALLMIIAVNAAWLSVGGGMWTQRVVVIVICGMVPYVIYLLFMGPRFLGRRRLRQDREDADL